MNLLRGRLVPIVRHPDRMSASAPRRQARQCEAWRWYSRCTDGVLQSTIPSVAQNRSFRKKAPAPAEARRSRMAGSISASIRPVRPGSNCCCSPTPTTRGPHAWSHSTRSVTGPINTGTPTSPALRAGQLYAYRADRPLAIRATGLRFDRTKVLLDPYGRAVAVPRGYDRRTVADPGDDAAIAMKSVVVEPACLRLGRRPPAPSTVRPDGDLRAARPRLHAPSKLRRRRSRDAAPMPGSSRRSPTSSTSASPRSSCYRCFSSTAGRAARPPELLGLLPVSFFAPHHGYASRPGSARRGRRVQGHGEGAASRRPRGHSRRRLQSHGRGRSSRADALLPRASRTPRTTSSRPDRARYANYTGTGNTLNANHPIVRRLIVDSLRYWVEEMHVDGFRFDLASILSRDASGRPLANPPILSDIDNDPVLAGTKLIAEAWDAAGLYQVGSFAGDWWKEWNGRFRDDVRSFWKGDGGTVGAMANRLLGSPDIYGHEEREPEKSVNFVTLPRRLHAERPRLVRSQAQRGQRRGESRRLERQPQLELRRRGPNRRSRRRAVAQPPGEEFPRRLPCSLSERRCSSWETRCAAHSGATTTRYCLDDDTTWFDWTLLDRHDDVRRFVRLLISQRLRRDIVTSRNGR